MISMRVACSALVVTSLQGQSNLKFPPFSRRRFSGQSRHRISGISPRPWRSRIHSHV